MNTQRELGIRISVRALRTQFCKGYCRLKKLPAGNTLQELDGAMAEELGLSRKMMGKIRQGERNLALNRVERLRRRLGAKGDFLDPEVLSTEEAIARARRISAAKQQAAAKKPRQKRAVTRAISLPAKIRKVTIGLPPGIALASWKCAGVYCRIKLKKA
jgi:hypothetical protein